MSHKYNYNYDLFFKEDAISYYLLGAFMTDGCIVINKRRANSKTIKLTSNDIDWLELIKNLICPELSIKYNKPNSKKCGEIVICSAKIAEWFISKGCTPNKSLTLKFPQVPEKYLPDFIRGCIDGDGCISISKNRKYYQYSCCLGGGSYDFLQSFNKILKNKNLSYSFYTSKKRGLRYKHDFYRTTLCGRSGIKFLEWIYYPDHPLSMPRKLQKAYEVYSLYSTGKIHFISNIDWNQVNLLSELKCFNGSKSILRLSKEIGCADQTIHDRIKKLGLVKK